MKEHFSSRHSVSSSQTLGYGCTRSFGFYNTTLMKGAGMHLDPSYRRTIFTRTIMGLDKSRQIEG
jgi:hypothetical protein